MPAQLDATVIELGLLNQRVFIEHLLYAGIMAEKSRHSIKAPGWNWREVAAKDWEDPGGGRSLWQVCGRALQARRWGPHLWDASGSCSPEQSGWGSQGFATAERQPTCPSISFFR